MAERHESGEDGRTRYESKAMRDALDGTTGPKGATKNTGANKGEAPKTGAMRNIGKALDGNEK